MYYLVHYAVQFAVLCEIVEMEKCEGEALVNNRKGKLIFFYDWDIVLKWTSTTKSNKKIEGKINIPNLSEENDISEVDVSITSSIMKFIVKLGCKH